MQVQIYSQGRAGVVKPHVKILKVHQQVCVMRIHRSIISGTLPGGGHPNKQQCLWDVPAVPTGSHLLLPVPHIITTPVCTSSTSNTLPHLPLKSPTSQHPLQASTSDRIHTLTLLLCCILSFHFFCFRCCRLCPKVQACSGVSAGHGALVLNWNPVSCYTAVCCPSSIMWEATKLVSVQISTITLCQAYWRCLDFAWERKHFGSTCGICFSKTHNRLG